jgi:hypothetical protein
MTEPIKGQDDWWPYRPEHWEGQDDFVVTGPGWDKIGGTFRRHEAVIMSLAANVGYDEGKKCERERVLDIVRQSFSCEGIAQEIEKKIIHAG